MLIAITVGILIYTLYAYITKYYKHWESKGVTYIKPFPFVGNMGPNLFRKKSFAELTLEWCTNYPDNRYVGFYQFTSPTLLIKDPELIKKLTIKEFDTFHDRRSFAPEDTNPLWTKNLSAMTGDRWQDMRATLSPSFTSNKMKIMFELMRESSTQFSSYYLKKGSVVTIEMKDAFTRFANDVIGTTAFGVKCNSLENKQNEFYMMGKEITNFSGLRALKFVMYTISPTLMKILNVQIFPKSASNFFKGLVKETLKTRDEKKIVRPDMIHLLMEAKKGRLQYEESSEVCDSGFAVVQESNFGKIKEKQKPIITDEDITAQVMIFFLAGFDTVSTTMSLTSYELAVNQKVQAKLRKEIDSILESFQGKLTYEALMSMKYLDMVISETLRKWPATPILDRVSVKRFTIEPELPEEKPAVLEKGTNIWIAVYGLHHDTKYYPNPEKFDPERFNDENKHRIIPFTYLPFGAGPRNCIGSRFALLEVKLIITEIISKFEIITIQKTQIPLELDRTSFVPLARNGIWLGLKPR